MSVAEVTENGAGEPVTDLPIAELIQGCAARWWTAPNSLPDLGKRYSAAEQAGHEARLAQMAESLGGELEQPPQTAAAQRALQDRYLAQASRLAQSALGFAAADLAALRMPEFADLLLGFARQARGFDSSLSAEDIFQAGRNVMSAGLLQVLLGRPLELTPAIFAYSLLYPYSDNLLDDPKLAPAAKRAFNQRFRERLAGRALVAADGREATIDRLVRLVEDQYPRERYPKVYASLLAIHTAQTRSMALMQSGATPYEVDLLGLTFDKGGTSVLADAYLVAGDLSREFERFAFELGAFLQFVDDLEDVAADLAAGRLSVYALTARHWRLDALTTRTLRFGLGVLSNLDLLGLPAATASQNFLQRGLAQAVIHAAGGARRWHSYGYLRELEAYTPFRYAFVDRLTRRLSRQMARAWPRLAEMEGATAPAAASQPAAACGAAGFTPPLMRLPHSQSNRVFQRDR